MSAAKKKNPQGQSATATHAEAPTSASFTLAYQAQGVTYEVLVTVREGASQESIRNLLEMVAFTIDASQKMGFGGVTGPREKRFPQKDNLPKVAIAFWNDLLQRVEEAISQRQGLAGYIQGLPSFPLWKQPPSAPKGIDAGLLIRGFQNLRKSNVDITTPQGRNLFLACLSAAWLDWIHARKSPWFVLLRNPAAGVVLVHRFYGQKMHEINQGAENFAAARAQMSKKLLAEMETLAHNGELGDFDGLLDVQKELWGEGFIPQAETVDTAEDLEALFQEES